MAALKLVTLISSDGKKIEVNEAVVFESLTIKNIVEETAGTSGPIPLDNIPSEILAKVIEFCKYHVESRKTSKDKRDISDDEIKAWVAEFMKVDEGIIFHLILAASYLNIQNLLDECCRAVAYMLKDTTIEHIRKTFNITGDYTPKEEEENRRDNAWAFEV